MLEKPALSISPVIKAYLNKESRPTVFRAFRPLGGKKKTKDKNQKTKQNLNVFSSDQETSLAGCLFQDAY